MLETKHENMNNIRADNSVTTNPNIMKSEYENLMESVRFINEKIDKLSQTNEIMSANNKTNNFTNKIDLNNILESVNTNVKNEISIIKSDITSISDRLDALELCK
jgi:FlaA1/EpsC-like NDP-sugar epimerase